MRRFILTGAPGCGKTTLIRALEQEGFGVVEEAATDVIALLQGRGFAEPWTDPSFIDAITDLQKTRQMLAAYLPDAVQFHDRSVICTAALAKYLEYPTSDVLSKELDRIAAEAVFERQVFFLRNLGFIAATEARRISFEEAVRFEEIHEESYRSLGFELIFIDAAPVGERIDAVRRHLR